MSLLDMIRKKGKSTIFFIGADKIADNYIETPQANLFFYSIQPTNVSVLSEDALYTRISALMTVLRGQANIELLCLNSRENFDANKEYLKQRINNEPIRQVREILEKDLAYFDKIQIQTVTSRQFYLIIRYRDEVKKETSSYLSQIERLIRQNNFVIKQANKDMFKQILAVYWNGDVTTEYFEDYDGERWVIFNG